MNKYYGILPLIIAVSLFSGICSGMNNYVGISITLNGLRDGDILSRYPLTYADTIDGGESCLWDLSNLKPGKPYKTEVMLVNDSIERYRIVELRT